MTAAALRPSIDYLETGVILPIPVRFRYKTPQSLKVSRVLATGSVMPLAYGVDYAATPGPTDAGGTLTPTASVAGARLRIRRVTPRAQDMDYTTGDTFPAESHELALDTAMLIDQEQDVKIEDTATRAWLVPDGETAGVLPPKASFAGKFWGGDATGNPVPLSGVGAGDTALRTDLANPAVGPLLLARNRVPGTFENRTLGTSLNDTVVSVFENFTPAQITAVRAGTAVTLLAEAIQEVLDYASSVRCSVFFPHGGYDLRETLNMAATVSGIYGEGAPLPPGFDPGLLNTSGTLFAKNHNGDCIKIDGGAPYTPVGFIRDITVSSNRTTYPTGRALYARRCGDLRVYGFNAFGIGGAAIQLGDGLSDDCGQIHLGDIYINNPGGPCLVNNSKWLKVDKIKTDGGPFSYISNNAPNADITQFHFEGASVKAIMLGGSNGNTRFRGGFVALTNAGATHGADLANDGGNTEITIECVQFQCQGSQIGIETGSGAWRSTIRDCEFNGAAKAIVNRARSTKIIGDTFLSCGLPIEEHGAATLIVNNVEDSTTGLYSIDHAADCGDGGIWEGNILQKPIKPTKFGGTTGVYGTNSVSRNKGFKTAATGVTTLIASGTPIPHGMQITPHASDVRRNQATDPADLAWSHDANNITPTWTGGLSLQFVWSARGASDGA